MRNTLTLSESGAEVAHAWKSMQLESRMQEEQLAWNVSSQQHTLPDIMSGMAGSNSDCHGRYLVPDDSTACTSGRLIANHDRIGVVHREPQHSKDRLATADIILMGTYWIINDLW